MIKKMDYAGKTTPEIVDSILATAIENPASDIHFDSEQKGFVVRMRIDGILYPLELEAHEAEEIISRIKILAQLDITEHRAPQDGRFEFKVGERPYNIRVSTMPTIYGEAVALRILNKDSGIVGLAESGLEPEQLKTVNSIVNSPYGIILVSGPTGSGKTTFLYSVLETFDCAARNIVTLEDPVESPLPGTRQIQIDENIGFDFAKSMRGVLRQDPNVIMLGEIRDNETAQLAFQAALTGMLVFSTFHTFDVPGLVIRLIEMGVPRSVVAHAISGVISTRLVRKICAACATPYEPSEFEKKVFLTGDLTGVELRKGRGCHACHESGYLGRTGLFEVVPFDDEIRSAFIEQTSSSDLRDCIKRKITRSMADSAMEKVLNGTTTAEEIIRTIGI